MVFATDGARARVWFTSWKGDDSVSVRETNGISARKSKKGTAKKKNPGRKKSSRGMEKPPLPHKSRNPARTKENIIQAAITEFSSHGMSGGRVERIANASNINLRMIYHYYGSKENLYVATLERVYQDVRAAESDLHIGDLPPDLGIRTLVRFTFDHFQKHPHLVNLVIGENLLQAAYLKKSDLVPKMTAQLRKQVQVCLERGAKENLFRQDIDAEHLWLTIFSLCWVPAANRYTMSWTLQRDLSTSEWLETRKTYVENVVMQYLVRTTPKGRSPARSKRQQGA